MVLVESRQSGSVIILILVAVALFAALSFTIMRGGTGSQATLTDSQARLAAMEIIAYGDALEKAVQRLRLRGCSETQLNFANGNPYESGFINSSAPPDKSCDIFDINGGKVQYTRTSDRAYHPGSGSSSSCGQFHFNASHSYHEVGTGKAELSVQINCLKKEVCLKINEILSIPNPDNDAPIDTNTSSSPAYPFKGVFNPSPPTDNLIGDDPGSGLTGKTAFCRNRGSSAGYQSNKVLLAR